MKKSIALILVCALLITGALVGCSKNDKEDETTSGLENTQDNYGFETVDVTDDNGKAVTNKKGEKVTTQIAVRYEKNKKGKTYGVLLDEQGKDVTNKKGEKVTIKTNVDIDETSKQTSTGKPPTTKKEKATSSTTVPKHDNEQTTEKELTTIDSSKEKVPSTSASGTPAQFSTEDQQTLKNMLEVPYLYVKSYENSDGIPIDVATHVALWMTEREHMSTTEYPSSPVVLNLFKYFGQTVVYFKSKCNEAGNKNIKYNARKDTFEISNFENKKQNVSIQTIEYLGNNNYYKVVGSVTNAGKIKKVTAIFQKNKLDSSLGFSIKALKWQ